MLAGWDNYSGTCGKAPTERCFDILSRPVFDSFAKTVFLGITEWSFQVKAKLAAVLILRYYDVKAKYPSDRVCRIVETLIPLDTLKVLHDLVSGAFRQDNDQQIPLSAIVLVVYYTTRIYYPNRIYKGTKYPTRILYTISI